MKNSVADRLNAQSSCAAQFIGNHIDVSQQNLEIYYLYNAAYRI